MKFYESIEFLNLERSYKIASSVNIFQKFLFFSEKLTHLHEIPNFTCTSHITHN